MHILLSFAIAKLTRWGKPTTLEEWVVQSFGWELYERFFKTYTEKVWGVSCNQIGAEWAAQRIKGLHLLQAFKQSLFRTSRGPRTLGEQFYYPVLGAGQMYEAMRDRIVFQGADLLLGSRVVGVHCQDHEIRSVDVLRPDSELLRVTAKRFFTSIPITHFFTMLNPSEAVQIQHAARSLYYREHVTVDLLINDDELFPDQWIYIHSPDVQMARVSNYNNFSSAMSGASHKTALSVEYFTFQNEPLWNQPDAWLKALAIDELAYLGLLDKETVEQAWVVREAQAYPAYYLGFQAPYRLLQSRLREFTNLDSIGRGGMYKYESQDNATMSGILAARNYLALPKK